MIGIWLMALRIDSDRKCLFINFAHFNLKTSEETLRARPLSLWVCWIEHSSQLICQRGSMKSFGVQDAPCSKEAMFLLKYKMGDITNRLLSLQKGLSSSDVLLKLTTSRGSWALPIPVCCQRSFYLEVPGTEQGLPRVKYVLYSLSFSPLAIDLLKLYGRRRAEGMTASKLFLWPFKNLQFQSDTI